MRSNDLIRIIVIFSKTKLISLHNHDKKACHTHIFSYIAPLRHSCIPLNAGCKGGPSAHFLFFWRYLFVSADHSMGDRSPLESLITPTLEGMGYELVRVEMQGRSRPTLQVMAERVDGQAMTVDDCADISRALSAVLDVEDPIGGAYMLEVSSPGIDRPLTRRKDFERFAGFDAKLETAVPVDGRKRFRGVLVGLDGEDIILREEKSDFRVPLADIRKAKLILTDALIEASLKEMKQ